MELFKGIGIGIAAGCLICTAAIAQEETATETKDGKKGGIRQMFKNFDTDGDGQLSDAEKEAAMNQAKERFKEQLENNPEFKARLLERFDADSDGALSDDELKTAAAERPERKRGHRGGESSEGNQVNGGREEMMKNLDTDGDGKLSDAEKEAAQTQFITKMKEDMENNSEMKSRLLEKFDADGDGALSDDELKTAMQNRPRGNIRMEGGEGFEGGQAGGREKMMKNLDTDGDGQLSDAEKEAAQTQFITKVKEDIEKNSEMKSRLLEKFDADSDGALSDDELKTMATQGPPRGGRGPMGEGMGGRPEMPENGQQGNQTMNMGIPSENQTGSQTMNMGIPSENQTGSQTMNNQAGERRGGPPAGGPRGGGRGRGPRQ